MKYQPWWFKDVIANRWGLRRNSYYGKVILLLSIMGGHNCSCLIICELSSSMLYRFLFSNYITLKNLSLSNYWAHLTLHLWHQSSSELGQGTVGAHWSSQVRGNWNSSKSPCDHEFAYVITWSSCANYICMIIANMFLENRLWISSFRGNGFVTIVWVPHKRLLTKSELF